MPTILLIEDAHDLAEAIRSELQAAGYSVLVAADGLTGLELDERFDPDLIVLGSMLPQIDGLEVMRRLRQSSDVPVLMLTACGEQVDRVSGSELRADDYLAKPINMRELIARIQALLRRSGRMYELMASARSPHEHALDYGPLRLSPETNLATLNDKPLDLTHTEFELLHLLVRNPGHPLSRSYLLDAVWRETYVAGDRSVDNAILRLRKKLGTLGEAIETVRGVGYRLRALP